MLHHFVNPRISISAQSYWYQDVHRPKHMSCCCPCSCSNNISAGLHVRKFITLWYISQTDCKRLQQLQNRAANSSNVLRSMTILHLSLAIAIGSQLQAASNSNSWHWFTSASQSASAPSYLTELTCIYSPTRSLRCSFVSMPLELNFGTIFPTAFRPSH